MNMQKRNMAKIKSKKLIFILSLFLALFFFYLPLQSQAKELDSSPKIKVKELSVRPGQQLEEGLLLKSGSKYISKPVYTDFNFNALGASWQGEGKIFVKIIEEEKKKSSDWIELETIEQRKNSYFSELLTADKGVALQYKISADSQISKIDFTCLNTKQGGFKLSSYQTSPRIISRAKWGADETWRYCKQWDKKKQKCAKKDFSQDRWPIEYGAVKKIVVHHSAGSLGGYDPAAIVRAMYFWHTITLGWGDIGYNYMIDHLGNVYEGRSGGDGAIAGHAYYSYQNNDIKVKIGYNLNSGSMGIVLLGNYNENKVSKKASQSLINLITEKVQKYNLKPDSFDKWSVPIKVKDLSEDNEEEQENEKGKNWSNEELKRRQSQLLSRIPTSVWRESTQFFRNRGYTYQLNFSDPTNPKIILNGVRNIIGHKDIDATSCPGDNLHAVLPNIRLAVTENLRSSASSTKYSRLNYKAGIIGKSDSAINIKPGEKKWVWVEYQNEGRNTWFNKNGNNIYLAESGIKNKVASIDSLRTAQAGGEEKNIIASTGKEEIRPGDVVRFSFQIEGPYDKEFEEKNYLLVLEDKGWFPESEFNLSLNVQDTAHQAKLVSQNNPIAVLSDSRFNVTVKYKNTGSKAWQRGKIKLNIFSAGEEPSKFKDSGWPSKNGFIDFEENSVAPNQIATFKFKLQSHGAGRHRQLYYLSYKENNKLIKIPSSQFDIITRVDASYSAELIDANIPVALLNTWRSPASLTFKNTGAKTWGSSMVLRSYSEYTPYFKASYFRDQNWNSAYAIDKVRKPVKPGESVTFNFKLDSPKQPGSYRQIFQLEYGSNYEEIYIGNDKRVVFKTRVDKAK